MMLVYQRVIHHNICIPWCGWPMKYQSGALLRDRRSRPTQMPGLIAEVPIWNSHDFANPPSPPKKNYTPSLSYLSHTFPIPFPYLSRSSNGTRPDSWWGSRAWRPHRWRCISTWTIAPFCWPTRATPRRNGSASRWTMCIGPSTSQAPYFREENGALEIIREFWRYFWQPQNTMGNTKSWSSMTTGWFGKYPHDFGNLHIGLWMVDL